MPNWCECDLYITGPKEELEKFLETVKSEESVFDFNRLIPYPEHFRELDGPFREWMNTPPEERDDQPPPDGFNQGGYEWCLENGARNGTRGGPDSSSERGSGRRTDGRCSASSLSRCQEITWTL